MKDLTFTIIINAPLEKVWEILWNDETYRKWTSSFNQGSYMESDWKVGGKTLFLDADRNGMIATIKELDPSNVVTFSHYGELNKGIEDTTSDRVKAYAGAIEKYELEPNNGGTLLKATVQTTETYEQIMNDGFNNGLQEVKRLAEQTDDVVNTKP